MQRRSGISMRTPVTIASVLLVTFVIGVAPAAAGTLKVTSFPSGAQVIVDGVNTGKLTPMNISLADGDHIVTVQIPGSGWNPDTRTVTIVSGNNDLSVTLLPTATSGPPGPKGDKGDQGIQGIQGIPGSTTRPDPACFDNANRYVNCLNGTVTDTVTGLIWLKDAGCLGAADWAVANEMAAALANGECGLADGSSPGDWRLPSKDEWNSTISRAGANGDLGCHEIHRPGPPSLTDDAGTWCYITGFASSFVGVANAYWSSTTEAYGPGPLDAWYANLIGGVVQAASKTTPFVVWPVRGGTR